MSFRTSFAATGLFSLHEGESAAYSATLDDHRGGPAATVLMRILDTRGAVVASRQVVLQAGRVVDAALPRASARSALSRRSSNPMGCSAAASHGADNPCEISFGKDEDEADGISIPRTYACSDSDGGGNGRLPDK